jgi:hypothetical protein
MPAPGNFSEADWEALKQEMREILIGLAKLGQTICYSDLAALLRTAHVHHRSPVFHRILDEMCREDAAAGHVTLATLVVRKDSGIPGMGYFTIAASEGADVADIEAYWQTEFERVCEYWGDR